MPLIDTNSIRGKLAGVAWWDFSMTLGGATYRMREPTAELVEAVSRLSAGGGGDVFKLAAAVLEPSPALDLENALAVLIVYVESYQQWARLIFEQIVTRDPGAAAVLAVLAPAANTERAG